MLNRGPFKAALLIAGGLIAILVVLFLPTIVIEARGFELAPKDRLDAEGGLRSALLQALGGLVLVTGLVFTARGFRLSHEGHITDRYAKSVEQLGSGSADVRIGGVFALERIARDSKPDRQTIVEVLTAFVREHSRLDWRTAKTEPITADVQAALTVLGRRPGSDLEGARLDFYHAGLRGAHLTSGDWRNAMFDYGHLTDTLFASAQLDGADLSFCTAERVGFSGASARGVHLVNAKYQHCWFLDSDFTNADFYGCDLTGSDFGRRYASNGDHPLPPTILTNSRMTKAILVRTNLRGVDLRTVRGLTREQLQDAILDENTVLPEVWGGDD